MIFSIQLRVISPHFAGIPPGVRNLNQRPFAHAGTIGGRFVPFAPAFHQFGPKGENPSLRGLGGMNRAAFRVQEMAMRVAGHAQAEQPAGAVDILAFEGLRRHTEESCGSQQIPLGQVNEAALPAAFGAASLALEAQSLRHGSL